MRSAPKGARPERERSEARDKRADGGRSLRPLPLYYFFFGVALTVGLEIV